MLRIRLYVVLNLSMCVLLFSCANIVAPTGGPRDEKAPTIKKRSLIDSAVNFKGGTIHFEFDEFVQLRDIQNQFIITPLVKTNPKITAHKKRVSIQIDDSLLEKNTTYTISMGNAIQDLKEGNPYKNLSFTFSTGSYFDSLSLHGNVIEANTGKPDTTSVVMLYLAGLPDSAFFREKPMYVQKVEGGNFFFKNLPNKEFAIYALKDLNSNLRYDLATERIAFIDKKVNAADSIPVTLYSFTEEEKTDTGKKRKTLIKPTTQDTKSTLSTDKKIVGRLNYSINADTVNKTKRTFDINDSLSFRFDRTMKVLDVTKIRIFQDDVLDASATIRLDSTQKIILVNTQWTEDALYKVILLKGFAQDSSGLQANAGEFYFKTKRKSDYGFLTVQCKKEESDMVELLRNEKVIARKNATDTTIIFPLLIPDNYQVRLLHDKNKNGKWDTGSFFDEKKQPEWVELFPAQISIKANWENKIDLKASFTKKPLLKK